MARLLRDGSGLCGGKGLGERMDGNRDLAARSIGAVEACAYITVQVPQKPSSKTGQFSVADERVGGEEQVRAV